MTIIYNHRSGSVLSLLLPWPRAAFLLPIVDVHLFQFVVFVIDGHHTAGFHVDAVLLHAVRDEGGFLRIRVAVEECLVI